MTWTGHVDIPICPLAYATEASQRVEAPKVLALAHRGSRVGLCLSLLVFAPSRLWLLLRSPKPLLAPHTHFVPSYLTHLHETMTSAVTLIIDERDSRVHFDGRWIAGGSSEDYKRTSFASNETNAAMTFQFNGTSISVVGDVTPGGTCSGTFTVDSDSTPFSSQPVTEKTFQQTFFSKKDLAAGVHTLSYKLSSCQIADQNLTGPYVAFDHLLYTAINPQLDGATFFVDDRDSSLSRSGSWQQDTRSGAFEGTISGGSTGAGMSYTFSGVGISVYGSLSATGGNVKASFLLDGQAQSVYSSGPQNATNVVFLTSKSLTAGQHTLKISSDGDSPLWIDYLLVDPGTDAQFPVNAPAKETNLGAIIGGSVGGGVVLVGAFIVLWMMMKKRRTLSRKRERYSGAGSTNYLWKNNGTIGTGADGLSYAASTGAWSHKGASIRTGTTGGFGPRRNSRASQPALPVTRPVLYNSLEDLSPGLPMTAQQGRAVSTDDERAPLSPSDADIIPATSYPPTPPYNAMSFDRSTSRPTTPGARSGVSYDAALSPSHTVTTFDPSVLDHDFNARAPLARSPSYRTTAPESHMVTQHAVPLPQMPPMPPMPSVAESSSRDRRASLTPSYITTVPVGATLEISDYLPPHVVQARQERDAVPSAPPSSFNPGTSSHRHERTPSYHTTASGTGSIGSIPPVPGMPIHHQYEPSAVSVASSASSKHPNIPHSPPQNRVPLSPPPRTSSRSSSRPGRPSGSRPNPRSGQPLPRPPSPSQSQTSTIHGGLAPSIMTVASAVPSVAPSIATTASKMTTAEEKHFEATGERPERFQQQPQPGGSQQPAPPDSASDPSPGEPPPQYQFRF
ncbi:hypothetical protein DL96DRAFT_1558708 [Flagelloscypha sp. PMI_526]|nr:hypothetical protein DL96DRAFT_1558708 [Flagelloscypha sp. PMI_526]